MGAYALRPWMTDLKTAQHRVTSTNQRSLRGTLMGMKEYTAWRDGGGGGGGGEE